MSSDRTQMGRLTSVLHRLENAGRGPFHREGTLQESVQASCYVLAEDGGRKSVLKIFNPSYVHNSPASVRNEAETLDRFSRVLADETIRVTSPQLEALLEEELAYLMTYFPGQDLASVDSGYLQANSRTLSSRLVSAMSLFYAEVGPLYGDFHHSNVLVGDDGGLCLVDPTRANPNSRQNGMSEYGKGVVDLAYWVTNISVKSVRRFKYGHKGRLSNLKFTAVLLEEWAAAMTDTDNESYLLSVFEVCDEILRQSLATSDRRKKLLYLATKVPRAGLRSKGVRRTLGAIR